MSKATDAGLARLGDPGLERRQVADADIGVDVDLRGHRRLGAQCGENGRRGRRRSPGGRRRGGTVDGRRDAALAGGSIRRRQFGLRLERDGAGAHVRPMRLGSTLDLDRHRIDRRKVGAGRLGDAAGQRREFHRLEEADQLRPVGRLQREIVEAFG